MSGIFGTVSKGECSENLFYGTDYHSHLGTEFGGVAVLGTRFMRQIHALSQSQFKFKFSDDLKDMKGNKGIGVISGSDEQPIFLNSKFGPFCLATNGIVENEEELMSGLLKEGYSFSEVSKKRVNTTELIAKLINRGDTLIDGIDKMFGMIEGSCSLLLLNRTGIYAARDRHGYNPLIVGKKDDAWAVTSETAAFNNLDFEIIKDLDPGEIVLVNEDGVVQRKPGMSDINQVCTFLWIYTGFPASNYEGINAEIVRERCGSFLAKKDGDINIDVVAGVPDSGMAHGLGYAMEAQKPFRRPLVKYTSGYGRSYTPPSQKTRDLVAKMKLIAIKEVIAGNSIVVCEDSIVRGTQLKNFTIKKLWDCGAKELHVRPACPPLMFPCKFNLSTRSIHELAARKAIRDIEGHDLKDVSDYIDHTTEKYKKMIDWIANDLKVTTLRFQTIDDMVKAIGLPREKICTYCWTGECPKTCNSKHKIAIKEIKPKEKVAVKITS
ncbi:MAG: amidophosphoribosyltransferase [Planctomycetota bacterium]|jgi:amidophosphoribosyltransferase